MTSPFSYPENNLTVTPLDDQHVEVSITIQTDYLLDFIKLFDSLTHFVRLVKNKDRIERNRARYNSKDHEEESHQLKEQYYSRLVNLFDQYTDEGFDRKTTVKRISATLRKENHPWSSPDLVRPSLVAAGRGGRIGRPRKTS